MEHITNQITLRGSVETAPEFSHENHNKQFYRLTLSVPRLSGAVDTLNVMADAELLNAVDTSPGAVLTISGQIRSHNIREDGVRHLLIFVFATQISNEDGEPVNQVTLDGPLCKDPIYRRTPLGREICDVMLAVQRSFRRADYLPCILWGKIAHEVSRLHTNDRIHIYGRLQSRVYTKLTEQGAEHRTAFEVSALTAEITEK